VQKLGIDFLCASGHKFYAPYGGGFCIGEKSFFDTFLPYQIGDGIGVRYGSFCVYQVIRDLLKISHEEEQVIISEIENGNSNNIPGIIRASLSICNTQEDIDRLVFAVKELSK
jgi:selenocysteine lyase/cysteine desulfurase